MDGAIVKAPTSVRAVINDVQVAEENNRVTATVWLQRGDDEVAGTANAEQTPVARWRAVAAATLDALTQLEPAAARLAVEMAGVQRIGERELGIVTILLDAELLAGVAPVRDGAEDDAMARAVLDATNRRLARMR